MSHQWTPQRSGASAGGAQLFRCLSIPAMLLALLAQSAQATPVSQLWGSSVGSSSLCSYSSLASWLDIMLRAKTLIKELNDMKAGMCVMAKYKEDILQHRFLCAGVDDSRFVTFPAFVSEFSRGRRDT